MGIRVNNKEIGGVYVGPLPISSVYAGSLLIWRKGGEGGGIACFSCGIWKDELPWVDTEIWKDNLS